MPTFVQRPLRVTAAQWRGDPDEIRAVCPTLTRMTSFKDCLFIYNEHGWQRVELDDWVICDRHKLKVMKADEFAMSYQAVDADA